MNYVLRACVCAYMRWVSRIQCERARRGASNEALLQRGIPRVGPSILRARAIG